MKGERSEYPKREQAHLLNLEVFLPMCSPTVTRLARVSGFFASFSYASCTARNVS